MQFTAPKHKRAKWGQESCLSSAGSGSAVCAHTAPVTLDNIILLTGPAEGPVLAGALRSHNPQVAIHVARSLAELEAVDLHVLRSARLIAFVTAVVVPARILNSLGFGAYNFHPGPPNYSGWVPAHFAVYERATMFGATVHVMVEQVDAGPIVAVELFGIPPDTGALGLEALAYSRLARLFWQLAKPLATQCEPIQELPVKWSGRRSTRRLYEAMCEIPLDISKEELDRRIEVFGPGYFGIIPTIRIHGRQFRYADPDTKV